MNPTWRDRPIEQRIQFVEELRDSIAADQKALLGLYQRTFGGGTLPLNMC
ncbi:MAG: hypothetical protein L0H63_10375 [Nitrococcus sp.]|nr:hypothetical protein [Nitrococcus sp.]